MVVLDFIYIALGLAGLYFGGDWLVEGASRLARVLGVPVVIIGLTIVAFGTSVPELVTNLVAVVRDTNDIAVGNIIGSNIANIGLILGMSAAIASRALSTRDVQRDWVIMLGVAVLGYVLLVIDGDLSRVDGLILVGGIVLYIARAFRESREQHVDTTESRESAAHPEQHNVLKEVGRIAVGVVLLVIGAQLTVDGAVNIARFLGVSELVIGVTLVAVGTSLPELATSVVAATKGQHEIALGNVIGSNIFNILLILGVTGVLHPYEINGQALSFDAPFMLLMTVLMGLLIRDGRIARLEGIVLVATYIVYIMLVFFRPLIGV
ncbi:MAG: calcium/sodium antiporter [Chloroflexi bacterium]|nr:calcium/sodium antiporter [Chloroflexota bacterium]